MALLIAGRSTILKNILFYIYRPISEQGTPSEVTAAVLYFPRREGEGGVNGVFGLGAPFTTFNAANKISKKTLPHFLMDLKR